MKYIAIEHPMACESVYIHFTDDCVCNQPIKFDCTCNQWFEGVVEEQLEDDENGNSVFHVSFETLDGTFEEIVWFDDKVKNFYWAKRA